MLYQLIQLQKDTLLKTISRLTANIIRFHKGKNSIINEIYLDSNLFELVFNLLLESTAVK